MAHKKGGGSSVNGRDSHGQRLGVKRFGGQWVHSGTILSVSAARNTSREITSRKAKTTHYSRWSTASFYFRTEAAAANSSASYPAKQRHPQQPQIKFCDSLESEQILRRSRKFGAAFVFLAQKIGVSCCVC